MASLHLQEQGSKKTPLYLSLQLVSQLMQDKHVLISRVADKQFAEQLGVDHSGHFEVLHNGLRFPFYGHPSPELIMQFIYQVSIIFHD